MHVRSVSCMALSSRSVDEDERLSVDSRLCDVFRVRLRAMGRLRAFRRLATSLLRLQVSANLGGAQKWSSFIHKACIGLSTCLPTSRPD